MSSSLLVLTPSNLGPQLQRLNAETGTAVWESTVRLADTAYDPANWADDGTVLFLAQGRRLTALTLADGRKRWDVPLTGPDWSWRIRRCGDYLLAWPQATAEQRFTARCPLGALQWGLSRPPEESPGRGCPLLAFDAATGRLVQRWNLPASSLRVRVTPVEPGFVPFEFSRGLRDAEMRVVPTANGLVVAVGGRAWGLFGAE